MITMTDSGLKQVHFFSGTSILIFDFEVGASEFAGRIQIAVLFF